MALHDWSDRYGWEGLHAYWMTEIARQLRADLPPGYRAIIGSSPLVTIAKESVKPDVAVTNGATPHSAPQRSAEFNEVAVAMLNEEDLTLQVGRAGRLIAVVELISPRNKDRPAARERYAERYLNYLHAGVHLLIADVHRRPAGFAFAEAIADALEAELPRGPAPSAVTYRVGPNAAFGGRLLAVWHRPLVVGEPLPAMPLPLGPDSEVSVDLDGTYGRAAADNYVE